MKLDAYLNSMPRGEAARIAAEIGEYTSNFSAWRHGLKPIPPYKCRLIVKATGGRVRLQDLRPRDYKKQFSEAELGGGAENIGTVRRETVYCGKMGKKYTKYYLIPVEEDV